MAYFKRDVNKNVNKCRENKVKYPDFMLTNNVNKGDVNKNVNKWLNVNKNVNKFF